MKEIYKLQRYRSDMENCPIVLLYGTYLPVAIMMFVIHIISYICDNMSKR